MSSVRCSSFLVVLAVPSLAAQAQEDPDLALAYGGQELVSIATGQTQPLHLAPAVASVITAEQIELAGATTLDEALALVPGLHVAPSAFNRLNPNWSIRGIHTNQTPQVLLLRDGVPVNHFYTGSRPNLFHLPAADIERIEVIRGPGSAIYGADAFAGAINVITRAPGKQPGLLVGARLGSFARRDVWVRQDGRLGDWNLGLSVEYAHTDGDRDRIVDSDLQSVFDGMFGSSASRAPGPLSAGYEVLNASLRLVNGPWDLGLWHWRLMDAGVGAGAAQALDPGGRQDIDLTQVDVRYRLQDDEYLSSDLRFSYRALNDRPEFVIFPAGSLLPVGTDGNIGSVPFGGLVLFSEGVLGQPAVYDRFVELDWTSLYNGWPQHQIRLGLGLRQEKESTREKKNFGPGVIDGSEGSVDGTLTDLTGTANIFLGNHQRSVKYLSLQDEWSFAPDWTLTGGLRYDHYSDFGGTLNPRLALVWATRNDLTSKLMLGRAFRPPSFGELYATNNPVVLGNPDLDPETLTALELAFDYRPRPGLEGRLSLFRYDIADLIERVPDIGGQTSTAQNVQDRKGHGLELEAAWQATPTLGLKASYAWQDSKDADSGEAVANTPGRLAALHATWQPDRDWTLALHTFWVAGQKRETADGRAPIADYALTNLTLRHRPKGTDLELALAVSNLFDKKAYAPTLYSPALLGSAIPGDYPLPGRSVWLELRYRR
jgi:outer membrane receptor for ferrienterochelin and colicins